MFNECLIYVRKSCPFCIDAISDLNSRGIKSRIIEIDLCPESFIQQLKAAYEHSSFPMILEYNKGYETYAWIGGYNDLKEALEIDQ